MGFDSGAGESGSLEKSGSDKQNRVKTNTLRMINLGEAGACITEFELGFIRSVTHRDSFERKTFVVRYQTGEQKEREMALVWVASGKGQKRMWADTITGTLFREDGSCRGSFNTRIVGGL